MAWNMGCTGRLLFMQALIDKTTLKRLPILAEIVDMTPKACEARLGHGPGARDSATGFGALVCTAPRLCRPAQIYQTGRCRDLSGGLRQALVVSSSTRPRQDGANREVRGAIQ